MKCNVLASMLEIDRKNGKRRRSNQNIEISRFNVENSQTQMEKPRAPTSHYFHYFVKCLQENCMFSGAL
jgi:hypothetical protein